MLRESCRDVLCDWEETEEGHHHKSADLDWWEFGLGIVRKTMIQVINFYYKFSGGASRNIEIKGKELIL